MRTRIFALAAAAALLVGLAGCASATPPADTATAPADTTASAPAEAASGTCVYTPGGQAASPVEAPPAEPTVSGTVTATIATSAGNVTITMDADRTPCTVENFVSLATQQYYDNTTCHRLTTDGIFVLQCGDPTASGSGGPGYSFADELDGTETYPAGTVAMANAGPNTNGSQFFLVYDDALSPLSPAYTVFGTMDAASLDVVKAIAAAGTETGGPDGPPKGGVSIESVTIG